mmetsp:Transcript_48609/g.118959  ORF Transcript_48609/g.118959 Transcript_48609/m.118959 type:complete len:275 (+) Transcript_48609:843-1667(+)
MRDANARRKMTLNSASRPPMPMRSKSQSSSRPEPPAALPAAPLPSAAAPATRSVLALAAASVTRDDATSTPRVASSGCTDLSPSAMRWNDARSITAQRRTTSSSVRPANFAVSRCPTVRYCSRHVSSTCRASAAPSSGARFSLAAALPCTSTSTCTCSRYTASLFCSSYGRSSSTSFRPSSAVRRCMPFTPTVPRFTPASAAYVNTYSFTFTYRCSASPPAVRISSSIAASLGCSASRFVSAASFDGDLATFTRSAAAMLPVTRTRSGRSVAGP